MQPDRLAAQLPPSCVARRGCERLWAPALLSSPAAKAAPAIRSATSLPITPTRSASTRSIRRRPARASASETLHAYVGAAPDFAGPGPEHVKAVEIARIVSGPLLQCGLRALRLCRSRCAAARGILAALADETAAGFVFHPYPVTPYHADYLHHLDRIEAASAPSACIDAGGSSRSAPRAELAETIVRARLAPAVDGADVTLEAVPVDELLAAEAALGGWSGPPWVKEGWFQAHRLLAPLSTRARQAVGRGL